MNNQASDLAVPDSRTIFCDGPVIGPPDGPVY